MSIQGLDLLAGSTYKKEVIQFSRQYAIGMFAEAFKNALPVADAALKAGCKHLRIQLLWRDDHNFGKSDLKRAKKLAAQYNKLANKYPDACVYLSPWCEHNISNPESWLDAIQLQAPNCTIVNTPWKGGFSKKYINEVHGDKAAPQGRYFYSFDGTEVTNSDVESYKKKHAKAEIFFLWTSRFNLRWNEKDKAGRPQRIKESRQRKPNKDFIESIAYLFGDKGTYNLDSKTLLKSHSEKHDANDRKGDKLLFITPTKADAVILKRNGKQIGKLPYYGGFEDGRYRYYAPTFGYKYGANVDVYVGKKHLGTVNCGFRSAPYR